MKRIAATIFFAMVFLVVGGQEKPIWLDNDFRQMKYPENKYFTGFAYGETAVGKSLNDVVQTIKTEAQADLSKKIRVHITSRSQSEIATTSTNGRYSESEHFSNRSETESNVDVTGINIETYHDTRTRMVYAFAYVNRTELSTYHKSSLAMNLAQAEGLLQTAQQLETSGEKTKSREQCELAKTLLAKIRTAQEILTATDSCGDWHQARIEMLHNRLTQMLSQLAQAVYMYMECTESNFSKPTTVLVNRLRSMLSGKGCSFTENSEQVDFRINIEATTRYHNEDRGFVTCYADVSISLFDVRKSKTVFQDEFSQKGVSTSRETAGRRSLEDAVLIIIEKVSTWLQ